MKNLLFLFLFLVSGVVVYAQPKMQLLTTVHDFGTVKQADGKQTYNFIVTNTGDSALVITNVAPQCGCTTPEWTKSPIPSKGQGKITAIYDAATYVGRFEKTLTVHSNSKPESVVLTIKGEVTPKEKTVEETYTWPVGTVRFESQQLAFTNVKKNDKRQRIMPVINTGTEPVKVEFTAVPPHLVLKVEPETLKPGQKGNVEGTYDGTKNAAWGYVNDYIKVKLNGVEQPNIYYYVSAYLVEDFSTLTKEEIANAPVLKFDSSTVDMGTMDGNTSKDVEFKYTNNGKRDLIVRYVHADCGCTAILQGNNVVKPGQSGSIKATFSSGTNKGKVSKSIHVITNDPKNSEVVLLLTVNVVTKTP